MKYFLFFVSLILISPSISAQDSAIHHRPKIGLTLSGGGAKGLAHIGILKALDSAGLKVDYITGTSMGSIIGALYAVGYSADSIEKIARKIDWDLLLSNQSSLRAITMEEKSEYSKYDLELPWVNNWFRLPSGVLEGQELWLKFSELFFRVNRIKNFKKFPIPFECIATDVSTGEAVVLDSGEVISAIRSSMAIPSVFTSMEYEGKKLIDGGVVRNFPVKDVREMGADFVIGSNVSNGLMSSEKQLNAIQILLQVAFFRESEDTRKQVPYCNIYIHMPLDKYTMGSFSSSDDIINAGIEKGRSYYPIFKKIADSLNALYGPEIRVVKKFPDENIIKISTLEVNGLKHTSKDFFRASLDFDDNRYYTSDNLARMVRHASGTRYYSRVAYSLQPENDSVSKIVFDVTESPLTFAKIGLNYNQFSGISAILNLTTRDFLTPNSRSLITLNIGENFRARAEHLQYFGRTSNLAFTLGAQFDQFSVTTYNNFKGSGLYAQNYFKGDARIGYSSRRDINVGAGTRFEWVNYNPSINSSIEFQGSNRFLTSYVFLKQNSLDRVVYPKHGVKIDGEFGWVYTQSPEVVVHNLQNITDSNFSISPYARTTFNIENYDQLGKRSVFLWNLQTGISFNYQNNVMNEFSIGGLTNQFHNQITFAGLREGSIYSPTVAAMQVGLRYEMFNNTFLTGKANVLFDNFISTSSYFKNPDFLSGYSLTFSYNFALGPLEISAMYCDQSRKVMGYVNIGIPF
ncbi:MAG: patatin-like phospholipase family protein [Bacteroidetes bacterium]|nr:patatin-like phospholipase family protein [Bacteroidota bacterium]